MKRLLKFSLLIFLLSACAKTPGFKASDYTYTRVAAQKKQLDKAGPAGPTTQTEPLKPGSIVRESNRIEFNPTDTNWENENVQFKANVKIGEKAYGEVEFKGTKKDSRILLTPVDESLNDKLRAEVICTSEDDSCEDFFIDVLYKENDVIYQDQIIPKPKANKTETPAAKLPDKTVAKQPPVTGKSPRETPSPVSPTQKQDTKKQPKTVKEEEVIADGIGGADPEKASYVGISDEEIREIFQLEQGIPDEPAPVPEETPAQKKEAAPATPSPKSQEPKKQTPAKEEPKPDKKKDDSTGKKSTEAPPAKKEEAGRDFQKLRVKNQVFGLPSKGWLKNGTDFLKLSAFPGFHFFIANPNQRVKDYFGSFDLAVVLRKLGEGLQSLMPNRRLAITAISKWGGGRLAPHEGHQNGTDVDIRYLTNNENLPSNVVSGGKVNSSLLVSNQWKLLKIAYETKMVDVMFVDTAIKKAMCEEARRVQDYKNGEDDSEGAEVLKRLQTWSGHKTHFHIRIRCSSDNPGCKRVPMTFDKVGC